MPTERERCEISTHPRVIPRLPRLTLALALFGSALVSHSSSAHADLSLASRQAEGDVLYKPDFSSKEDWPDMVRVGDCGDERHYDPEVDGRGMVANCTGMEHYDRLPVDFDGDFDYRITGTRVSGTDYINYGIRAGFNISDRFQLRYRFLIDEDGEGGYLLIRHLLDMSNPRAPEIISLENESRPYILAQSSSSSAVKRNSSNDFRLVKEGNSLQFFLNNRLIFTERQTFEGHSWNLEFGAQLPPHFDSTIGQVIIAPNELFPAAEVVFTKLVVLAVNQDQFSGSTRSLRINLM